MSRQSSQEKIAAVKTLFEAHQDAEQATSMSRYMRDQFLFYGIPAPQRRKLYRPFLKEEKKGKQIDWIFLDLCMDETCREFQYLAYDYLLALKDEVRLEDIPRIRKQALTKPWWDTIDFFDQVIGSLTLRDERVKAVMREWPSIISSGTKRRQIPPCWRRSSCKIWAAMNFSSTRPSAGACVIIPNTIRTGCVRSWRVMEKRCMR